MDPRVWFQHKVYRIVRAIPPGKVMTYGSVAVVIPPPPHVDSIGYLRIRARWVGYALAKCPQDVPWHRVLNAQGKISPRAGLGPRLQRHLLETEGVRFTIDGRVNLQDHLWHPQDSWLLQQGLLHAPVEGTVGLDKR